MIDDVGRGVPGVSEEVRAVVSRKRIEGERVRERMERRSQEPIAVDIGKHPHGASIANPQQVEIVGLFAILAQERNRIESRTVVMKLAFNATVLGREDEVPVASSATVVTPMWQGRIVSKDRIERDFGFIQIAKIFRPRINLLLTSGIPGHLATQGISLRFPAIGAI